MFLYESLSFHNVGRSFVKHVQYRRTVFWIRIWFRIRMDPLWFSYPRSGSRFVLGMRFRIQIQEQRNLPNLTSKPDFQPFKMALGTFYGILPAWSTYIFLVKIQHFVTIKSLTRSWIRIRIWSWDPQWRKKLGPDPDPHCNQCGYQTLPPATAGI
jgi:hypothetical protein